MVTVVESEVEWLNGDPDVVAALGDGVLAYTRRDSVKNMDATLTRVSYVRVGRDSAAEERIHTLKLSLPWLAESASFDVKDGQHDLDVALAALEARICHPDRTHGDRWLTSGTEATFSGLGANGLSVQIEDAGSATDLTADSVITCTLTWTVTERVPRLGYV